VCFNHLFLVNVELNQSILYATNFGSSFIMDLIRWAFFLGLLVRWLFGLSKTSLFLMFNLIDNRDDVFEATDNNDRDNAANKKSVDNQEDTVNPVEDNGDNSETNKTLPLDGFRFLLDSLTLTYHSSFP
jgi:hypothetical protein